MHACIIHLFLNETTFTEEEVMELHGRSSMEKGEIQTNNCKKDNKAEWIPDNQTTGIKGDIRSAVVKGTHNEKHPLEEVSPCTGKKQAVVSKKARRAEAVGKNATRSAPTTQQFVGKRKLWGTTRVDTEEEVKTFLVTQ